MQYSLFMRGGERGAQPACDLDGFVFGQSADTTQQRGEILAVHVFHRHVVLSVGLGDVEHPADVRMRHLAGHADFVV